MAKSAKAPINSHVLRWARNSVGYSVPEVSQKVGVEVDLFNEWEKGSEQPSFAQLKRISEVLKRPSAIFFLDSVPNDLPPPTDFRVLGESEISKLAPKTVIEIRKAQRKRILAIELAGDLGVDIPIFREKASLDSNITSLAKKYRDLFSKISSFSSDFDDEYGAFNFWKDSIEQLGVLVFQASLESLEQMRGLAIYDSKFPMILLNTKDSVRGRIFSLLHEFCHLLLQKSGIGNMEPNWKQTNDINQIEIFCNRFAAEVLVPNSIFKSDISNMEIPLEINFSFLKPLMNKYQASWEVVLRRLLDLGFINQKIFLTSRKALFAEFVKAQKQKKISGFVPVEVKAVSSNGGPYTRLVLAGYDQSRITAGDFTDYLGVNFKHFEKIRRTLNRKTRGA